MQQRQTQHKVMRGGAQYSGVSSVPGATPRDVFYEHASKYAFAAGYVRDRTVLDIGCAAGMGADLFRRRGARAVVGVEINPETLWFNPRRYRAQGHVMLVHGDGCRLPLADRCMEVVVALEVIEHVEAPGEMLHQCARVLRPDGVFVVSTPNYEVTRNANPWHVREYTVNEFEALLREHFTDVALYQQSVTPASAVMARRCARGLMTVARGVATAAGLRPLLRGIKRRVAPERPRMTADDQIDMAKLDPRYDVEPYDANSAGPPAYILAVCRP